MSIAPVDTVGVVSSLVNFCRFNVDFYVFILEQFLASPFVNHVGGSAGHPEFSERNGAGPNCGSFSVDFGKNNIDLGSFEMLLDSAEFRSS